MDWQDIISRDPFPAGSLAWDERGLNEAVEELADSLKLVGEIHQKFIEGWNFASDEEEKERKEKLIEELNASAGEWWKGDPAR